MRGIITRIATKHGLDLTQPGGHLKLTMPNMLPLVIETLPGNQVSVAHYGEQNGDPMRDPEVVFMVQNDEWVAAEVTQDYVGKYQRVVWQENGVGPWRFNHVAQADLASFVRTWSRNIRAQGWLDNSIVAT
jgi:hypothetical protein